MRALLALAFALTMLAGCSDKDDGGPAADPTGATPATPTPPTGATPTSPTPGPGISPQPDEVDVEVSAVGAYPVDPAFDPEDIQVPAGALVHVTFRNEDTLPVNQHNWVVDGITDASSATIAAGEEDTFDFTAPAMAGEFTFYCSVGDHRDRGMEGTLSVTVA